MRAAIFLNGTPPTEKLLESFHADLVICADGAYCYLKKYKKYITMTNIVLGDFDSFVGILPKNAEIMRFPAKKDKTDSELALLEAIGRGASEIDIFGATGGRDDHALGNLGLLFKAAALGVNARIVTEYNVIYPVAAPSVFCKAARKGQIISLVPFGGDAHIIETNGLRYGVIDKTLSCAETLGISNVAAGDNFSVELARGKLLVFIVTKP